MDDYLDDWFNLEDADEAIPEVARLAAFARAFLKENADACEAIGLYKIAVVPKDQRPPDFLVVYVRDDAPGGGSETWAAQAAHKELTRRDPALASRVRFWGEYCK